MSDLRRKSLQQPELFTQVDATPIPSPRAEGRDELNLAEFPLAALSTRIAPGQKTLEFKDRIFDNQARQYIDRTLTVSGTEKYGLPTSTDDEIILALIQLSKKQGFTSKEVPFTRYEIIQILGWDDQTWGYQRILEALDRWTSVTLKYENAWREPVTKTWVDVTFHIIEQLNSFKDENGKERASFVWSDVIFKNLQNGHVKALDLDLYRRLQGPTAKRLYRLLDKKFYLNHRVEYDLIELAINKLGIARTYQIANIKQRLEPAIAELENIGFIGKRTKARRYRKHGVRKWNIIFEKASAALPSPEAGKSPADDPGEPLSDLEVQIIAVGVTPIIARRLCTTHAENFLREKLDVLRFLTSKPGKAPKNPAGYLVKSIEEQYAPPAGYLPLEEVAKRDEQIQINKAARLKKEAKAKEEEEKKRVEQARLADVQTARVNAYLENLPAAERKAFESETLQRERNRGSVFTRLVDDDTIASAIFKKQIIEESVIKILEKDKV